MGGKKGIRNLRLLMELDDIEKAPEFPLPEEFRLEPYKRGMEKKWVAIHKKADKHNEITEGLFYREFGGDEDVLSARQMYLMRGDEAIGTATAWFGGDGREGGPGRPHWIAVIPEWQGRGLSKPLLSAVCARMSELGHQGAWLSTGAARTAAINLYLGFGFKPLVSGEEDVRAWRSIRDKLRHPVEIRVRP